MAKVATVAYEKPHKCKAGCGCPPQKDGAAGVYAAQVQHYLEALGETPDAIKQGQAPGYLVEAEIKGIPPQDAAAAIKLLASPPKDMGGQDVMVALEKRKRAGSYRDGDLFVLGWVTPDEQHHEREFTDERERDKFAADLVTRGIPLEDISHFLRRAGAAETKVLDYVAVDSRDKVVFGPTTDYGEAKLHALRAGGVVKFSPSPARVRDCVGIHTHGTLAPGTAAIVAVEEQASEVEPTCVPGVTVRRVPRSKFGGEKAWSVNHMGRIVGHVYQPEPGTIGAGGWEWSSRADGDLMVYPVKGDRDDAIRALLSSIGIAAEGPHAYAPPAPPAPALPEPFTAKLEWHRSPKGDSYFAEAEHLGTFHVHKRAPNRRKDVLPWYAELGGVEVGQGDTKADAYAAAAKYARKPKVAKRATDCIAIVERSPSCVPSGVKVETAAQVFEVLRDRATRLGHEEIGIINVSVQDEQIGSPIMVASGQVTGVHYALEQLLAPAIKAAEAGSKGFWLWHLHPSGHHEPTDDDKDTTARVKAAVPIVLPNTTFKGHVVIGAKGFSLA